MRAFIREWCRELARDDRVKEASICCLAIASALSVLIGLWVCAVVVAGMVVAIHWVAKVCPKCLLYLEHGIDIFVVVVIAIFFFVVATKWCVDMCREDSCIIRPCIRAHQNMQAKGPLIATV